jgi:hypothetical protein
VYAVLTSPTRATCPAHLILVCPVFFIILSEEYKLWSSSLCKLLYPPVPSYLCISNIIFSSAFCSQTSTVCVLLLGWMTMFQVHKDIGSDKTNILFRYHEISSLFCSDIWIGDRPVARSLPTQDNTTQKGRHTFKHQMGFEPAITRFEQSQTVHTLPRGHYYRHTHK